MSVRRIISTSALPETQKEMWGVFFDVMTEKEISPILDALTRDASMLPFLTVNLEEKLKATADKDISRWKKIIREEKAYLKTNKG